MQTFCICTLGCKVNQYESEQIASLLRSKGLRQADQSEGADLRIINTCSVTVQAASKSRQTVRQSVRLPVLGHRNPGCTSGAPTSESSSPRTIVTGCWATSDGETASKLPGVNAVITHHDDVAARLEQIIQLWTSEDIHTPDTNRRTTIEIHYAFPERAGEGRWTL